LTPRHSTPVADCRPTKAKRRRALRRPSIARLIPQPFAECGAAASAERSHYTADDNCVVWLHFLLTGSWQLKTRLAFLCNFKHRFRL